MLAESVPQRLQEESRGRLIEQAFGSWLTGQHLHPLPLIVAQIQGAKFSDEAITKFSALYPDWQSYLTSLGLLEDS